MCYFIHIKYLFTRWQMSYLTHSFFNACFQFDSDSCFITFGHFYNKCTYLWKKCNWNRIKGNVKDIFIDKWSFFIWKFRYLRRYLKENISIFSKSEVTPKISQIFIMLSSWLLQCIIPVNFFFLVAYYNLKR